MSTIPTVLIIEDDPVFRRVLSFTVAKMGLAVETANDGDVGFDRLMQGDIDFIVTDHQMPRCGGVELFKLLKEVPGYMRPPAILCTAKGLELDSESLRIEYDLVTVMHKPFSPRKLSELILEYLESARDEDSGEPDPRRNEKMNSEAPAKLPPLPPSADLGSSYPQQGCGDV